MIASCKLLTAVALLVLSELTTYADSFGLVSTSVQPVGTISPSFTIVRPTKHSSALFAEGEASNDTDESSSNAGEEEEKEDPVSAEVKELKDQIAQMESTLKQKNRDLSNLEDLADNNSEIGYARKVAEMEGYRRSKNAASADSKDIARATVLQPFLPILDDIKSKAEVYSGDEFAKGYSALGSDFSNTLKNLGVSEFAVTEGETINFLRTKTIKEEYSDTIAKGCVITPLSTGYELKGNVMRQADVIVSLGSEADAKAAAEAKAAEEVSVGDGSSEGAE